METGFQRLVNGDHRELFTDQPDSMASSLWSQGLLHSTFPLGTLNSPPGAKLGLQSHPRS